MSIALKRITLIALPLLVFAGMFTAVLTAFAETDLSTGDPSAALTTVTGAASQLSNADEDPFAIIGRIINYALGLLGIVFFGMVLYAGWLWMTSGGESEKAKEAQKLIMNAIIGILIILSAAAVSNFVISNLLAASTNS